MAKIIRPDGQPTEIPSCGSCIAAEKTAGGHIVCRRNPPSRTPTGASIWPIVDADKDWCTQHRPAGETDA